MELLHITNPQTKLSFKNELKQLLESNKPVYEKTDTIAKMFIDVDEKINYIKSQISLLNGIKKQLESARQIAKEEVASLFNEYGLDKLEGMLVSSITINPEKEEFKECIKVLDEDKLIQLGYAKVDEKKIKEAVYSEKYPDIEPYVSIEVENKFKPATIRINKRKIQIPIIEE